MAFSTSGDQDPFLTLHLSLRCLMAIQQGHKENTAKYYKRFRVAADVLMGHWGEFYPPKLVTTELTKELTQDRFLARILLMGADKIHFGKLLNELNNNYISGTDQYPKTLDDTIKLLMRYLGPQKISGKVLDDNEEGMVKVSSNMGSARTRPFKRDKTTREKDDNNVGESPRGNTNRQSWSPLLRGRAEGWHTRPKRVVSDISHPAYMPVTNLEEVRWQNHYTGLWIWDCAGESWIPLNSIFKALPVLHCNTDHSTVIVSSKFL
jgi:hypothetical protein